MKETITALLVQAKADPSDCLRQALEELSLKIRIVQNCGEAALILWSAQPPHLVFTDVHLADGNWADILTLAAKAPAQVNVIVVAALVDVSFYIQAIERGAFDFIVPPLSAPELLHVVRIAAQNALACRRPLADALPQPAGMLREPADPENELAAAETED